MTTIADIGELVLIERLKPYCQADAIGDDAAILDVSPGCKLVATTDVLVEGVHFSEQTTPPYSIGWRAIAANLSDLAAMGAQPLAVTVGLGLPGYTPLHWIEELYRGMAECLGRYGGAIVGGDLCKATAQTVSITALGEVQPPQVIRRDTATPGMTVVVTGTHGASRAGLALLLDELTLSEDDKTFAAAWIRAHQLPVPRFDAIAALKQILEGQPITGAHSPVAGMDSSDGLANALLQLSSSSGVGMDVVRSQIPLPPGLSSAVGPETALSWALYGGEDFELVLCMPPQVAEKLTQTPFGIAIGTTTDASAVRLFATKNSTEAETILKHQSFQHFVGVSPEKL
ncbi:MAG: thiamine-phosphate kinase [Cyanobacteria bacterium P01_D01_bin.1]